MGKFLRGLAWGWLAVVGWQGGAEAQVSQVTTLSAKLVYTPPTQRTDGSAITGPLFYVVLSGAKGQSQKSRLLTTTQPNATNIVVPNVSPGTCFQLIAVENQIEGPPSSESCIASGPNSPANLQITLTITMTANP